MWTLKVQKTFLNSETQMVWSFAVIWNMIVTSSWLPSARVPCEQTAGLEFLERDSSCSSAPVSIILCIRFAGFPMFSLSFAPFWIPLSQFPHYSLIWIWFGKRRGQIPGSHLKMQPVPSMHPQMFQTSYSLALEKLAPTHYARFEKFPFSWSHLMFQQKRNSKHQVIQLVIAAVDHPKIKDTI